MYNTKDRDKSASKKWLERLKSAIILLFIAVAHLFILQLINNSKTVVLLQDADGQKMQVIDVSSFYQAPKNTTSNNAPPILTVKNEQAATVLKKNQKKAPTSKPQPPATSEEQTVKKTKVDSKNSNIQPAAAQIKNNQLDNAGTENVQAEDGVSNASLGAGIIGENRGAGIKAANANSCTPAYPRIAKENEEQGVVVLELTVNSNGTTSNIKILNSSGFKRLDKAAMRAMAYCTFYPALRNGVPIALNYKQKFIFSLEDAAVFLN